jgi:hypothetical protein
MAPYWRSETTRAGHGGRRTDVAGHPLPRPAVLDCDGVHVSLGEGGTARRLRSPRLDVYDHPIDHRAHIARTARRRGANPGRAGNDW